MGFDGLNQLISSELLGGHALECFLSECLNLVYIPPAARKELSAAWVKAANRQVETVLVPNCSIQHLSNRSTTQKTLYS